MGAEEEGKRERAFLTPVGESDLFREADFAWVGVGVFWQDKESEAEKIISR